MKHDTVAALILKGVHVLLCQRSLDREWYPGVWDLPGGHVVGEAARDALTRELREELGISADLRNEPEFSLENEEAQVLIWEVRSWTGELRNAAASEHAEIAWVHPTQAIALDLGPLAGHILREALGGKAPQL